ncbi:heterokaryon incompatibility protein-domain-containing protein [Nemania diffusa]|nr:heterokaryon incompatibility protein-domain-containing protein [Nemania diffusa]
MRCCNWGGAYGSEWFWIDAFCINQIDLEERRLQVNIMDKIYGQAEEVMIWLGPSNDASEEVFKLVRQISRLDRSMIEKFGYQLDPVMLCDLGLPHPGSGVWRNFLELYEMRWFHRIWVIQEVVLAKYAVAHWGRLTMPWKDLLAGSQIFLPNRLRKSLFSKTSDRETEENLSLGRNALRIESIQDACILGHERRAFVAELSTGVRGLKMPGQVLLHLMHMARDFHCSDQRDRVYSLLGLATYVSKLRNLPGIRIAVDYSDTNTPAMVLTLVATIVIRECNCLGIISQVTDPTYRHIPSLPSWVPDFMGGPNYSLGRKSSFDASGLKSDGQREFRIENHFLFTHSVRVGRLEEVVSARHNNSFDRLSAMLRIALRSCAPRHVDRIEALWRTMIWDVYGHGYLDDEHPAPPHLKDAFIASIAPILQSQTSQNVEGLLLLADDFKKTNNVYSGRGLTSLTGQIIEMVELLVKGDQVEAIQDGSVVDAEVFTSETSEVTWAQGLFRVGTGYLGMGPHSSEPGDELWIISGCPFPMVLRFGQGEVRKHSVIGRAPVHGLMHGEGLCENSNWEEICLK